MTLNDLTAITDTRVAYSQLVTAIRVAGLCMIYDTKDLTAIAVN